jgi:eukaryotic-like serine/threonine-protein kinase
MKLASARRLGRFELERKLGSGAQGSVWLAHDPRLDREVAVKLLDPASAAVNEWLDEARAVSRLRHPNIVPVFEADREEGQAYLVFEYVEGPTLAEAVRQRPLLPPREAAQLMLGVLDALAAAHAQGIVHRDLKPSNILLGTDGRPRVMDFGIAARVAGGAGAARIVGTPGYISPEAARGEAPVPAMDVFGAGVMLAELLGGQRLRTPERDVHRALARAQQEDLALPASAPVDDALRGIVQRALARDPAQRYEHAQAMHAALHAWLNPADAAPAEGAGRGTLEFLLRRMRHKGDFPALSESVARIQKVATSETESLASLSTEILKDVALTNKLLRMVNSAHFTAAGGAVSTVSRAAALVGFAGIRNMALSLLLLEHMRDKGHAAHLKQEFLRTLAAGSVAAELASSPRDGEEAFLGSMFQGLGRLLTEYYFPEEALQIRQQTPHGADPAAREAAAARVLGIGFEELGVGIAKSWGLPDNLLRCMRTPHGDVPARAVEAGIERQRWLGRAANDLAEAMLTTPDGDALKRRVEALGGRYGAALGLPPGAFVEAAQQARQRLANTASAMGLQLAPAKAVAAASAMPEATITLVERPETAAPKAASLDVLAAGIQEITNTMVDEHFRLNEVLRMVLETMYRALDFRRVVFCLRDAKQGALTGRFGLGDKADAVSKSFHVPLRADADLFGALCAKGADTLIADARADNIARRLPAWYRQAVAADAFLLLPMMLKGAPFALIYADRADTIVLGEKELSLLRTLRNQAVMAFRQSER